MKRIWRNYSLSITLGCLFVLAWVGQLVTQWFTWANEQQDHNQPLVVSPGEPLGDQLTEPGQKEEPRQGDAQAVIPP